MNIWSNIKKMIGRLLGKDESSVLDVLSNINPVFKPALALVRKLDEELKPLLKVKQANNQGFYVVVLDFLEQFRGQIPDIYALAVKVANLPIGELLFVLAIEILKTQTGNPTLSMLRLAVELAYSVYKNSKKETV